MTNVNNLDNWNRFIYQLIYPGFIGSMIYELLPASKDDISGFINPEFLIKLVIVIFYCIDYFHLYGDIYNGKIENCHSLECLVCDFGVSVSFFIAFVLVKLEIFNWALILLAFVPGLFFYYKRKNIRDRKFNIPYSALSALIGIFLFLNIQKVLFHIKFLNNPILILLIFSICSMLVYFYYVVKFQKNAKKTIT